MSIQGNLAKAALDKFPETPTLTLAKKLYKKHPEVWSNLQSCRGTLQYHRGASGKKNLMRMVDKRNVRPVQKPGNPFLPVSSERKFTPYLLEGKVIGVLSDVHIPYHNTPALEVALAHFKKRKVDTILLNGDTIDFYQLSRFEKDPRERSAADEIAAVNEFLDYLQYKFPKAKIIWKDGNHDERYTSYLRVKAPELLDIPQFRFPDLMSFANRGIEYVTDKRLIHAGKLTILHGHEYRQTILAPVNAARGFFLKAKDSTLTGHLHQTSEHTEPTVRSKMITCFSSGCLCELHPHYMPLNRWNHGFAVVEMARAGDFEVENRRIHHGVLL